MSQRLVRSCPDLRGTKLRGPDLRGPDLRGPVKSRLRHHPIKGLSM
jgi:hypothetical protein